MSWKYVNPGYGELIPADSNISCATVEDWSKNPQCGVMAYFAKTASSFAYAVSFTNFNGEIYGKYITYCTDNYGAFEFYFGSSAVYLYVKKSSVIVYCNYKLLDKNISDNDGLHSVSFHYKLSDGDSNGIFELTVDDVSLLSHSHSYSVSDNIIRLASWNYCKGTDYSIGNIILSDEAIALKESVVILPTSGVETNMRDNQDGTYTADEEGQILLQTVNAKDLIAQYGRNSKITSIAPFGVPAYKTAEGLSSLVGIDKINRQIAEHNTKAVSSDSTSGVFDCWNTDITIGNLDGKQIGWKAAM